MGAAPTTIDTWSPSGAASTPGEQIPDGHIFTQPWPAGPNGGAPGSGHLLPVPARPGAPHPARDRRADRQGREGGRGAGPGQAQPVHPAAGRHPQGQQAARGEGQGHRRREGRRDLDGADIPVSV